MRIKIKYSVVLLLLITLTACDRDSNHTFQGYVESDNLLLASPFAGNLIKLPVVRGEFVNKADLLFQLDPNPQQIETNQANFLLKEGKYNLKDSESPRRKPEVKAAEAVVGQVNARLRLAELRKKRYHELYTKRAGDLDRSDQARERVIELQESKKQSEAELELAKLGARKNKIEEKKARVDLLIEKTKLSKWELAQKTGYAPNSGIVFDTYYHEGEWVPAGSPVISFLVPEYINIEFFVPAAILSKLRTTQTVYFTCEGCAAKNEAVINYISPEAEYVPPLVYSRSNYDKLVFRIKASPEKPGLFKPGQPVTITGFKHDR
jgi:HlyD family secretion protein